MAGDVKTILREAATVQQVERRELSVCWCDSPQDCFVVRLRSFTRNDTMIITAASQQLRHYLVRKFQMHFPRVSGRPLLASSKAEQLGDCEKKLLLFLGYACELRCGHWKDS